MVVEPSTPIVAIVEGTALSQAENSLTLIGGQAGYIFKAGHKTTIADGERVDYLLQD
jgi:dipeptidase E